MPGPLKTEGIVLRSLRYGEADRILHVYTPHLGRLSAIAKGARRTKSRFGARLEPFVRADFLLYEGRSDLLTVTSAQTRAVFRHLREDAGALDAAARACDAVSRLFDQGDAHPEVFNLLTNELELLDSDPKRAGRANTLSFRLKLLLAAGLAPQLSSCASCGDAEHLAGFSGPAGGVVCVSCEASSFPLSVDAHNFLTGALGSSLADAPTGSPGALRQAERAISETVEHHAGVRLRPAAAA